MYLAQEDRAVARLVDAAKTLHDRRRQPDLVAGDGAATAHSLDRLEFAADPIGLVEIGGHQLGRQDVDLPPLAKKPRNRLGLLPDIHLSSCRRPMSVIASRLLRGVYLRAG